MLRKSILAVTLSLLTVGGLQADDGNEPGTLMKWLQGPSIGRPHVKQAKKPASGIRYAVISDAAKQAPQVRQTSGKPSDKALQPAVAAPMPTPATFTQTRTALAPIIDEAPRASAPTRTVSGEFVAAPVPDPNISSTIAPSYSPSPVVYDSSMQYGNSSVQYGQPMHGGAMGPGSLYPAPRPGIPHQVGGTMIPTHALHPHEMLHAHRYKSMYGPYYYKVRGGWMVTPFGVWSKENWQLKGTTVDVKYKSHISPFAMFSRPVIR